jgi:xanthine dehydrogenase accessory factor
MSGWVDTLVRLRDAGPPAVVVTVMSTKGSVPRGAGTKMIVTAGDVYGTIGGGHLEHKAIAIARDQLGAPAASDAAVRRFPLGASLGQCCGGLVNLLFEPLERDCEWLDALASVHRAGDDAVVVTATDREAAQGKLVVTANAVHGSIDATLDARAIAAARALLAANESARVETIEGHALFVDPVRATDFRIVLFGAGHVGRAIVHILAGLPCRVTWVDERDIEFPRDVPANTTVVCTEAPEAEVAAAPAGVYFLVMTHSHAIDETLAEAILNRGDYAYFGLIGSMTKRRTFEKRMERRGMPAERFATMTCPIGIAGIPGKEPAAIAIAVAAELLQVRARIAVVNGSLARRA